MAEKSSFFTSLNGDRRYKASDFAEYFKTFIGNGVFPNPSTNLQVIANGDMTLTLSPGYAWLNGYMYSNTDDLVLTIDHADSALKRIDRVVIRCDYVNREIRSYVKKGIFSQNPSAPVLTRDTDAYELCIAEIQIDNGVVAIQSSKITDTRLNTEICGIVTQTINEIDTTTLYNQLQSHIQEKSLDMSTWITEAKEYFSNWLRDTQNEYNNEFNNWFDTIKGVLDGDIAGNLANRILELENKVGSGLTANNILMNDGSNVQDAIDANETSIQETNTNLENLKTKVENGQIYKLTDDDGRYMQIIDTGNIDNPVLGWFNYFNAKGTLPDGYSPNDNDFLVENKGVNTAWLRQTLYDVRSFKKFERMRLNGNWSDWREL